MAQRSIVFITDDLDGTADAETVTFAYQGRSFEIDLSEKNRQQLEEALEPYIAKARRASSRASGAARPRNSADLAGVRAWAQEKGHAISSRGRIPRAIMDAYAAAH